MDPGEGTGVLLGSRNGASMSDATRPVGRSRDVGAWCGIHADRVLATALTLRSDAYARAAVLPSS